MKYAIIVLVIALVLIFALEEFAKKKLKDSFESKVSGKLNIIWELDENGAPSTEPLVFAIFKEDPGSFKPGEVVTLTVSIKNTF